MQIPALVGERIRSLRKERRWSQEELAREAGLHPKYIGQIERAEKNVTLESLIKITGAFDITLEELFRHLQPLGISEDASTISRLVNLLLVRNTSDRKFILKQVEDLLNWKDGNLDRKSR